ncbi:hypothetical protein [Elizabethkingia meningoseptica]|uniref:hypothetical protein n=1 Tax=Elizabethkingia meningoseptica TaxID=238 RepID=UPI0038926AB1
MKNIVTILLCSIIFTACNAQTNIVKGYATDKSPVKDSLMFEKFDFDLYQRDYTGYERVGNSNYLYGSNLFYKLKKGEGVFYPEGDNNNFYYFIIPNKPAFYGYSYVYYKNGNIEIVGKVAGFANPIKIGTWRYYDENGNLTKTINEEEKFGLWGFNKVLDALDKDKVIDLKTGRNREAENLRFNFDKEKKIWTVKVFRKLKTKIVDEYYEYLFEGNTGKYTRNLYERYNLNAAEIPDLPPLKNSKANKKKQ